MEIGLIVFAVAVVLIVVFFAINSKPDKTVTVDFGKVKIKAELADTYLKRVNGLMFHKTLAEDGGMLFVFDSPGRHAIWMMNMSFPIDIMWLDEEKEIVHVVEDAQPCFMSCPAYAPPKNAKYVIEVNSGFVKKYGLETGHFADFEI